MKLKNCKSILVVFLGLFFIINDLNAQDTKLSSTKEETILATELGVIGSLNNSGFDLNIYEIGSPDDQVIYYVKEIDFPEALKRGAGGRIRLIMQHELTDQVRIIELLIGLEQKIGSTNGKSPGKHGFTINSAGGMNEWVLGNGKGENIADPWQWAWITDYRWREDNQEIPGDKIRIYSHPHVVTKVIIYNTWP